MNQGDLVIQTTEAFDRQDEKLLIARARRGERAALRELVDRHKDRLFAFIWRMVRHHHDAEEICQDAFLKAFASLDSFSTEFRFSTWLFTIGYRVCLNHLRRRRAPGGDGKLAALPVEVTDDRMATLESEEAGRLRVILWGAVDRLSPPQRAALLLFYRQGLGCHEIARVLEVPVATVKSHLHRARSRLRELLEPVTEAELEEFRNRAASAG
jgi:RNA polymerase sigma-70 factor (ECF subfamily)